MQMVSTKKTLASTREIENFHYYKQFVQQQLNQTIPGTASLVIERYSAESMQTLILMFLIFLYIQAVVVG